VFWVVQRDVGVRAFFRVKLGLDFPREIDDPGVVFEDLPSSEPVKPPKQSAVRRLPGEKLIFLD